MQMFGSQMNVQFRAKTIMNRREVAKNVKEDSVFDIVRNFLFFNIVRKPSKSSKNEQKTSLFV
jgi:hypothetical protein